MGRHNHNSTSYDAVVIGAGMAGETCARQVRRGGLKVALIDRVGIGGETATWAAIPSASLLGPANARWQTQAAYGVASPAIAWPRSGAFRGEATLQAAEKQRVTRLKREDIAFLQGEARIVDPGRVEIRGDHHQFLETKHIVIATGSIQRPPEIPGLEEAGYWTALEASTHAAQPTSVLVLDGGMWAVELAQVFRHYGSEVTLITTANRLVLHEDPEAGELLARHLKHSGIRLIFGSRPLRAEHEEAGTRRLTLDDGSQVRGEAILIAGSRMPNTQGLGLEDVGISIDAHSVNVDDHCRAAKGIWAVGDVTGVAPRSHVALYQARLAADDILGKGHAAHYETVPRIIFTDPQVAATGLIRAQAQAQHIDVISATLELAEHSLRPGTAGAPINGRLTLHADRQRDVLIGAWAVAPDAGEWIQLAVLAIRAGVPIAVLRDTVEQFPPFSEGYFQALDELA